MYSTRVKSIIRRFDPNARVYVFGSVVRGEYTALSDIDILAVISNLDLKYNIMVTVYSEVNAPVELHIVTPELYENWYERFIKPEEIIEI
jgi:predicted nucleotidyltransferase